MKKIKKLTPKQLLSMIEALIVLDGDDSNEPLGTIYRIVHSHSGRCRNPHSEWLKDTIETYKELKKTSGM